MEKRIYIERRIQYLTALEESASTLTAKNAIQLQKALLNNAKKAAEECLEKINRDIGCLEYIRTINPQDEDMEKKNPAEESAANKAAISMIFGNDEGYELCAYFIIGKNAEESSINMDLSHDLENGREIYNWETGEWCVFKGAK